MDQQIKTLYYIEVGQLPESNQNGAIGAQSTTNGNFTCNFKEDLVELLDLENAFGNSLHIVTFKVLFTGTKSFVTTLVRSQQCWTNRLKNITK